MLNAKRSAWLGLLFAVAFSINVAAGQQPAATPSLPQTLHLLVNRSLVITSPVRIRRLSIANPDIAEALVISPYQVLINGKTPGAVTMILWGENGESQTFDLYVDVDVLALSQKIHDVFPAEQVRIEASKDVVMLTGQASSADVADRIYRLVSAEVPKVISLVQVPTPPTEGQVLLQVKFAEVDLSTLKNWGFNFFSFPGTTTRTVGALQTQQFGPLTLPTLTTSATGAATTVNFQFSSILNLFLFRPDINMGAMLQALENKNLLQILAEPNLLTETGKEATFLAGGEFPFPSIQGGAAGAVPTVTIQFKEFGVRLNFTPTLTADNQIDLKVTPEVSTLDFSNALQIQGFLIPALSARRVSSEMMLRDGQTFAIAGMLDNRTQQILEKIPWIGDLPVLGKLFHSSQKTQSRSELLVLVTPHIVKPYEPGQAPKGPAFPVPFLKSVNPDEALKPGPPKR
ncbi:MAG TPA: pilus assembly protein N-terminal domain-containing protein [Candidatus Acidoferrales bacterium]|nr:pilus assembly protein N-terminal domain-containing protein [Candidatus Acidoferrales bacterium]